MSSQQILNLLNLNSTNFLSHWSIDFGSCTWRIRSEVCVLAVGTVNIMNPLGSDNNLHGENLRTFIM
jgi:hypothetical protein